MTAPKKEVPLMGEDRVPAFRREELPDFAFGYVRSDHFTALRDAAEAVVDWHDEWLRTQQKRGAFQSMCNAIVNLKSVLSELPGGGDAMTEHELAGLEVILAKSDVDGWSLVPSEVCQKLLATARREARMRAFLTDERDYWSANPGGDRIAREARSRIDAILAQADDGDGGKG